MHEQAASLRSQIVEILRPRNALTTKTLRLHTPPKSFYRDGNDEESCKIHLDEAEEFGLGVGRLALGPPQSNAM